MRDILGNHLLRLAIVEGAVLLALALVLLARIALRYDGTCGSIFPFVGEPARPCSWLEYMGRMLVLVGGLGLLSLRSWRGAVLVLAVLLVPAGCYILVGGFSLWLASGLALVVLLALAGRVVEWFERAAR
jgi:hypothetical protein